MEYTLWICVIGGEDDDERMLYEGNNFDEVEKLIIKYDDEVQTDPDKYFLLNDTQFYSHEDFIDCVNSGVIR